MLRAGLIGFGGIARAHRVGYATLEKEGKAELVCACDIDPAAFDRRTEINLPTGAEDFEEHYRRYTDLEEMLAKEEIDFLDVCLPSYLHAKVSAEMLRRGYHVICEKPMALTAADCRLMLDAERESGKHLMVAQCLRFYPAFDYIKEVVTEGRFGRLLGATLNRLSVPPVWGWENWFMDPARSGGCLTDLHVHDLDIARYLFGEPEAVMCRATTSVSIHDTVHTSLFYGDAPVTVIGDWSLAGMKFCDDSRFDFEKATVAYTSSVLTVYPKDGTESYDIPLEEGSPYCNEISYFCDVIDGRCENVKNPAISAARTILLVEHLRKSIAEGGKILPFDAEAL